ncbi:MAG: MATE family efflux transporter [Firmicutes bacterium]|nr:MATE family efflux transporter [Bacillota bacterium]MDD4264683.1 MATE family efflux transporter [Bacillota bacterium]MDD4693636.1 MATE family efflux transporter [Bacillota bacterium]
MISQTIKRNIFDTSLLKKIVIFAVPIMAMNVLQLLFNAADMIVVGRYSGSSALAAVGATGSLINLIVNLFMGLSVGTSVVVARDYGASRSDDISRSVHTSITVSMISGIFVMILGILVCEPLLALMGTPHDIIDLSTLYMKIYFVGIPASMVYNFGAAILRATGDSKRPMYYLTITGIVNVILNMFFVIVLNMSVDGVALATVISQYLAMYIILLCLSKESGALRFRYKKMSVDKSKLKDIVKIGLPAGLQSLLFSISNVLIQSAVNSFGSVMVAASAAAANIEGIVSTSTNALYNAAITFTGQSMGAKNYDLIDEIAKVLTVLIFATWIVLGGLTVLFSEQLLGFYTPDPEVIELGVLRIKIMMVAYFTAGAMNVYPGLTRAMGYSVLPMLSTLIGAVLMRIIWLLTIFTWYPTVAVLFAAYPVTWALAGLGQVLIFFYARKKIRLNDEIKKDDLDSKLKQDEITLAE